MLHRHTRPSRVSTVRTSLRMIGSALLLWSLLLLFPQSAASAWSTLETDQPQWLNKPVLHFLLNRPDAGEERLVASGFTPKDARRIMDVARREGAALLSLKNERDPSAYNTRLEELLADTDRALRERLDARTYLHLSEWTLNTFEDEAYGNVRSFAAPLPEDGVAYRVFATQYAPANGEPVVQVAVPDKYVKFASQCSTIYTWPTPPSGYSREPHFVRIYVPATGITDTLPVCEVGPWNTDDNYWNAAEDLERPRRTFTDLRRGNPQSQAAYFWDHNDGKDAFGRTVANPAGIDLSFEAARRLGLRSEPEKGVYENAWVWVTYLWELPGLATRTVWPGDTNADGVADERDILAIAHHFGAMGEPRAVSGTTWAPHEVDTSAWPYPHAVHADANGDGIVNETDIEAVETNWHMQHD